MNNWEVVWDRLLLNDCWLLSLLGAGIDLHISDDGLWVVDLGDTSVNLNILLVNLIQARISVRLFGLGG